MYYSDELIEEVRSRNDIVDVISSYVKLKKSGATYFGLCPFHNEKSPSFSVTPSKQMYYCFGCGEGGNIYSFIMKYENYSFLEAVKLLVDRAGVALPEAEYSAEEKKNRDLKATLFEINKKAAIYFYHQLKSDKGKVGLSYFRERGLSEKDIVHFGLGYADKTSNDLYRYLKSLGYADEILKETGLFSFLEKGTYDKFFNRVMFPILDINGRVIGFGGRVMGEGKPKYLNSPETRIFEKSRNLYGMNFARTARASYMLICEGYMDVIALQKSGFTNAVAALGTAFSEQHAMLLKRYIKEAVLTFDSDEAGRKAALRAIPLLKKAGIAVKVLDMSPYKDPDEFIKNLGTDEYQKRIDGATDAFIFEIRMLKENYHLTVPREKAEFYNRTAEKLLEFQNELERNVYIDAVSREFMIPLESLESSVKRLAVNYVAGSSKEFEADDEESKAKRKVSRDKDNGIIKAQRLLLTWLIEDLTLYDKIKDNIDENDFLLPIYHKVAEMLFEQFRQGEVNPAKILNEFMDEEEHKEAAKLFNTSMREDMSIEEKEKALNDMVIKVRQNSLDEKAKNVSDVSELQEIIDKQKKLKKLHISL